MIEGTIKPHMTLKKVAGRSFFNSWPRPFVRAASATQIVPQINPMAFSPASSEDVAERPAYDSDEEETRPSHYLWTVLCPCLCSRSRKPRYNFISRRQHVSELEDKEPLLQSSSEEEIWSGAETRLGGNAGQPHHALQRPARSIRTQLLPAADSYEGRDRSGSAKGRHLRARRKMINASRGTSLDVSRRIVHQPLKSIGDDDDDR